MNGKKVDSKKLAIDAIADVKKLIFQQSLKRFDISGKAMKKLVDY